MNRIEFLANLDKYKGEDHSTFLQHYGILGQKWGQRRWQNPDGTFNEEGKQRYFGQKSNNTSSEEKIGGYTADHFHKNIYLKTDKNTLKKIKKYPDIYNTEGLTDDEILKAVRRVPKIPNARAYGREIREELYNTQLNKTRSKYYETNTKDILEAEDVEEQKIGGLFSKKTDEEKAEKKAQKEADKINDFLDEEYETDRRHWSEVMNSFVDSDSEYYPLFKQINENNDKILAKDYEKVEKMFDDYDNNEDEYVTRAAIANALINDPNTTLGEIGTMSRFYLMDDGDQGYANSANLYARYEKNLDMKELQRLYMDINNNDKLKDDNVKYLKENNPVLSKIKDKYLYEMIDENDDMHFWDKSDKLQSSLGALYNATDGSVQNGNLERNAYDNAKKITNKLHKSCSGDSGWDYLNQAIQNLGLSSVEVNSLSSADWDKINAEINKLKK